MQLLIYTPATSPTGQNLLNKIAPIANRDSDYFFDSLENLIHHLRKPVTAPHMAVLLLRDDQELSTLIQLRHLLRDMRIVLILPNRDGRTISNGHILRPRYVSYGDGDMSDVVAVVRKMIRTEKRYYLQAV